MSEHPLPTTQPSLGPQNKPRSSPNVGKEVWVHITKHVGVGIICAVAYFDPYVSLFLLLLPASGSHTHSFVPVEIGPSIYKQVQNLATSSLFVVLLSGLFAVILQVSCLSHVFLSYYVSILTLVLKGLACKLGVVTGLGTPPLTYLLRWLIRIVGSLRPCFSLSSTILRSSQAPQTLSVARLISPLCTLGVGHYQYRSGRATWDQLLLLTSYVPSFLFGLESSSLPSTSS
jgi:hypothetical protein